MQLKFYPFLTYIQRIKIAFQYIVPQFYLTQAAGWLAERRWGGITHLIINLFVKRYQVNLSEAAKAKASDYQSFNEFFIRPLKDNARLINQDIQALCLPADGCISELGHIQENQLLQAKGHLFSLETLLANDLTLAKKFKNGSFITTYLSPRDYHRVHMPCDATLRKMIYVPGELFSVNPFLAEHIPNLFARNERIICEFETEFGPMVQILVGAMITASMSTMWAGIINPPRNKDVTVYEYLTEGETAIHLKKGQEMGAFRLGSTVINLFPAECIEFDAYLKVGEPVKMGERLGKITN